MRNQRPDGSSACKGKRGKGRPKATKGCAGFPLTMFCAAGTRPVPVAFPDVFRMQLSKSPYFTGVLPDLFWTATRLIPDLSRIVHLGVVP